MRRSIPLFVLVLVSGCGNSANNNTGGNGTADMSGTSGGGGACSVVKQDCGSGQKCVPKVQGAAQMVVGTVCVPNGTIAADQPCMMASMSGGVLNDNCVAGTICDNSGGDSSLHCRKSCDATNTCSGSSTGCAAVYTGAWGLCIPSCTPFGNDCPSGNDCSTTFDAVSTTANAGVFACKMTGPGKLFASCSSDTDCGANLACIGPQCVPVCDNSHQCSQPPGDGGMLSCQSYMNLANGAGVCG
jgi:hypothetical protein